MFDYTRYSYNCILFKNAILFTIQFRLLTAVRYIMCVFGARGLQCKKIKNPKYARAHC